MIIEVTGEADYWDWDTVCRTLELIGPSEVHCQPGPGAGAEAYYWCQRHGVHGTYKGASCPMLQVIFTKARIEVKPYG